MPRAGLDPVAVTHAAARLADDVGLANVTMGALAERLGVRAPSLYRHIDSQADLHRRIALLVADELGDALREALQGRAGKDALAAAAQTIRAYVVKHPGRYAATVRLGVTGPDDPLAAAWTRVLNSLAAVLSGYDIDPADTIHVLRLLRSLFHGFATVEATGGFEMDTDVDESFDWIVDFVDRGLHKP
ncbi:TetR/AcrR family transcriptional regulator [Mycolicibacterium stellerae]|uniref:TetR/AcrR family transcriptional regulator n=1 Tax=Mycolicibacterium stellerae TaxID=2358193 RepID=UPI000F0BC289|nr:TetR/AcrR family transcriptional regulator [Mycolicibacterium stellerae]